MNAMTSELLQELDQAELKAFKPLFNYSLNTRRETKEIYEEVRKEYVFGKKHPNSFKDHIMQELEKKNRFGS